MPNSDKLSQTLQGYTEESYTTTWFPYCKHHTHRCALLYHHAFFCARHATLLWVAQFYEMANTFNSMEWVQYLLLALMIKFCAQRSRCMPEIVRNKAAIAWENAYTSKICYYVVKKKIMIEQRLTPLRPSLNDPLACPMSWVCIEVGDYSKVKQGSTDNMHWRLKKKKTNRIKSTYILCLTSTETTPNPRQTTYMLGGCTGNSESSNRQQQQIGKKKK